MVGTLGVVVAGGLGTRLGSPKARVTLAGRPLLRRALDLLAEVADHVVVAAPASLDLGACDAERAADAAGAEGPLAGFVGGLAARAHRMAWIVGVDFPLLRAATLRALAARLGDAPALMPCVGGVAQPLVCVVAAGTGARLAEALAAGERSAARALLALGARTLDDGALAALGVAAEEFLNVNTPAELALAERALAARVAGAA
jgi:molybdenum cofactor guanylyltransferase